jgi:hypothetical protein
MWKLAFPGMASNGFQAFPSHYLFVIVGRQFVEWRIPQYLESIWLAESAM